MSYLVIRDMGDEVYTHKEKETNGKVLFSMILAI